MKTPPKKLIAKNFSRASVSYNKYALVQKSSAKDLCLLALPLISKPAKILDLGSGTSFLAQEFYKNLKANQTKFYELDLSLRMLKYWSERPDENFFSIQADIEDLPFKPNSFDLVISSFSLQWLNNFEKTFAQIFSILKPGSMFAFCLPTYGSLFELREASIHSECDFNFNELPKIKNLKSALEKSGLKEVFFSTKTFQQPFKSNLEALRSLKKIGAKSLVKKNNLVSKVQLQRFNDFYLKKFSDNTKVRLSWLVSYFIFTKTVK